jgi:protein-tyrosine phosphatase
MIDEGVAFARSARLMARRLLVHCEHGIGRSAMLVLCILTDRGVEPMAALRLAKQRRARVSPSPAQYEGWAAWLRARASHGQAPPPSYAVFAKVAYGAGGGG